MKKLLLAVTAILVTSYCMGQKIEPIEKQIGKLSISVDPRLELLNSIQVLSNYPLVGENTPYTLRIAEFFKSSVDHNAIKITQSLLQNYGFSYDAPVAFMLTLSQPDALNQATPLSDYLTGRAGGAANLDEYRLAIKDFAEKSNFREFWKQNIPMYTQMIDLTVGEAEGIDWVDALENYYNQTQNSYNIILFPISNSHGYATKTPAKSGKYDLYASLSAYHTKDGVPYLDKKGLIYFVWHEFSHTFVNEEVEKHPDRLAATSQLFAPIETVMSKNAYSTWTTCINEHIIRAIHIRLIEKHFGQDEAKTKLNEELVNKFIYIEPILEKLKEFEEQRDSQGITFFEYVPTLLNVFDELLQTDYSNHPALAFSGPVNKVFYADKIAIIYPTNDSDTLAVSKVRQYAKAIFDMISAKQECIFISDEEAIDKDLSRYAIIAYGTLDSNTFMSKFKSTFPFRVEKHTLYADKEYSDKGVRFISCLPNPLNRELGMVIYTALSNNDVLGMNSIFHGPTDYVISDKNYQAMSQGYYKKDEDWKFE